MSEPKTCANCRWYEPGDSWPDYELRGACGRITIAPGANRAAQIKPTGGNAYLSVAAKFSCSMYEHTPKGSDDDKR